MYIYKELLQLWPAWPMLHGTQNLTWCKWSPGEKCDYLWLWLPDGGFL